MVQFYNPNDEGHENDNTKSHATLSGVKWKTMRSDSKMSKPKVSFNCMTNQLSMTVLLLGFEPLYLPTSSDTKLAREETFL